MADPMADPKIRTSKTADIGTHGNALIFSVDRAMGEALGFHWSYSDPSQTQRSWTFRVYLSDVDEGGGTRAPGRSRPSALSNSGCQASACGS